MKNSSAQRSSAEGEGRDKRSMLRGGVLVGGASRRMGRAKALLAYRGRTFLEHALETLRPMVDRVSVVGGASADAALRGVDHELCAGVDWLADAPAGIGPLGGIAAGLDSDRSATWVFVPCDMPGLTREAIRFVLDRHPLSEPATVGIIAGSNRIEPFPLVIGPEAGEALRRFIRAGGASLREALADMGCRVVRIPDHLSGCWRNVNTPEDLSRFLRRRRGDTRSFDQE